VSNPTLPESRPDPTRNLTHEARTLVDPHTHRAGAQLPQVAELLRRWEDLCERGEPVSPEVLCWGRPEWLDPVRRQMAALGSLHALLHEIVLGEPAPPADSPATPTANGGATDPAATVSLKSGSGAVPPAILGLPGYEILGEVGRGGMGVVYKARHRSLNRLVALKMILAGAHAGPEQLARFQEEGRAVARLQHPNIVQVYEVGTQHGLPFLALEYCPGGSLEDRLAGNPLPPEESAELIETLARAMQYAHERGVVHRDLKPANVLSAEGGFRPAESAPPPGDAAAPSVRRIVQAAIKITDFGLAKQLDTAGQTQTGAVLGTPSYMAPEQAAGKGREVGPAADVYALGAILYECLTGRPPFKAATTLDTVAQVIHNEPVAPRSLQPRLPADLETVCLKCLQKEPRKRYGSAAELAEDLRRFRAGEAIRARPVGVLERAWRWCRRNPAVASLLAAVALTLLAGTVTATSFALQAHSNARDLEQALRDKDAVARRGRATALRLVQFVKDNPEVTNLRSEELVAVFLHENPDLSDADLIAAFAHASPTGAPPGASFNPAMLGD
jgi:serine/threonine protein kinase